MDQAFEATANAIRGRDENRAMFDFQAYRRNGGDINRRYAGGGLLLHHACFKNFLDLARVLIEAGIEIEAKDENGFTALYGAACEGHLSMVQYLQGHGADLSPESKLGFS